MKRAVHPWLFHDLKIRCRGYLPHWEVDRAYYFITFRLVDSLPATVVDRLKEEYRAIVRQVSGSGEPSLPEKLEISRRFGDRLDTYLDRGYGACRLRRPEVAKVVAEAIDFFDGDRYRLHAWSIMPNHVHVVFFLERGKDVARVMHSWKSFTGKEALRMIGGGRHFWQTEYFDRVVRDEADLADTTRYVLNNPARAGLRDWPWTWQRA